MYWIVVLGIVILLLVISIPYLYAWQAVGDDLVFGGFIPNPLDGNSYLAKMRQGYEGHWAFTLPYTAEPGEPAYLNMFYLFLGHLARLTSLPLIIVYHAARLVGTVFLSLTMWHILGKFFEDESDRVCTWLLLLFGLGLGVLEVIFLPQFPPGRALN